MLICLIKQYIKLNYILLILMQYNSQIHRSMDSIAYIISKTHYFIYSASMTCSLVKRKLCNLILIRFEYY